MINGYPNDGLVYRMWVGDGMEMSEWNFDDLASSFQLMDELLSRTYSRAFYYQQENRIVFSNQTPYGIYKINCEVTVKFFEEIFELSGSIEFEYIGKEISFANRAKLLFIII
ncbi:unnamed protein product [Protopolystoma xenopodis]|uniref:Uncharacterized protein n=1 Tax=Protopolystoma xenopodis TaxID=117903 RepID=A0A3S5ABM2_9PLAT|nr:unnamed protein product [Protopolystoma xenopodis]